MYEARSDARNMATLPTSSGSPGLCIGNVGILFSRLSFIDCGSGFTWVSMSPGRIVFTRIR